MAPIRVALIGLSQSAKTSWASQAHLPYLLSERGKQRYQIAALLNSSVEAAEAAIAHYGLSPSTKAYGSPFDLARDSDIDLVVCTTRVDVHYDTIKPSVDAGKAVFVEWPLAENAVRAHELAELARDRGASTLVGLQGRVAPAIVKLREMVQSQELGRVLSSSVQAFTPWSPRDAVSEGLAYFLDKKVGGNPVTIAFGHSASALLACVGKARNFYLGNCLLIIRLVIDPIHSVLGEYETSDSLIQIQRPEQWVTNKQTGAKHVQISDVPDLVCLYGQLKHSASVVKGASLVVNFRRGAPFPGTKPFVWTINCEKGEIRLSSDIGPSLHSEGSEHIFPIEIHDFASNETKSVEWEWEDWRAALPPRSRNIAKLYDLKAEENLASCADFESAVQRHQQLDEMLYK